MLWGDLENFKWEDIKKLTWEEIKQDPISLLHTIQEKNIQVSDEMLTGLIQICNHSVKKYNLDCELLADDRQLKSPKKVLTLNEKLGIISVIIAILQLIISLAQNNGISFSEYRSLRQKIYEMVSEDLQHNLQDSTNQINAQ